MNSPPKHIQKDDHFTEHPQPAPRKGKKRSSKQQREPLDSETEEGE